MSEDIHSCSYYCTRPACVLAQRDELREEVERLRVDAARYQWLREQPYSTWHRIGWNTVGLIPYVFAERDAAIDAAIDAARERGDG